MDKTFFIAAGAMHTLRGAQQELMVIAREMCALWVWAHKENQAISHALHEAGKKSNPWSSEIANC
jgi:hypothetical protein